MSPVRIVQVGVGDFGMRWLDVIEQDATVELVGVVSRSADRRIAATSKTGLPAESAFDTLTLAIADTDPSLILLVTPPDTHGEGISEAQRNGIAVLCEKPITTTWQEATALAALSQQSGVALSIAENYRFRPIIRRARTLIEQGIVGKLLTVNVQFARAHSTQNYHMQMEQPLLMDVAVHHFDSLRYLTGQEVVSVNAQCSNPTTSQYRANAVCRAELTMTAGVLACYAGSLAAVTNETEWYANWELLGTKGTLAIRQDTIYLPSGQVIRCDTGDDGMQLLLADVIAALQAGRMAETNIADNLRSFGISVMAVEASRTGKVVTDLFLNQGRRSKDNA